MIGRTYSSKEIRLSFFLFVQGQLNPHIIQNKPVKPEMSCCYRDGAFRFVYTCMQGLSSGLINKLKYSDMYSDCCFIKLASFWIQSILVYDSWVLGETSQHCKFIKILLLIKHGDYFLEFLYLYVFFFF